MKNKDLSNNLVAQHNDLLVAVCNMTVKEKLVFLACISQIDSRKTLERGEAFKLTVDQAQDLFYSESSRQNAYRDLQAVADKLMSRIAVLDLGGGVTLKTYFVQSVVFDDNEGSIELLFAEKIKPYVSELESNFTRYKLAQVQQMQNKNAVRLFELSTMWLGQSGGDSVLKTIELDKFREIMGHAGSYRQFGELKKMIATAIGVVNETTGIAIECAYQKRRRSFYSIQLEVSHKQAPVAQKAVTEDTETVDWITGLSPKQVEFVARNHDFQEHLGSLGKLPSGEPFGSERVVLACEKFINKAEFSESTTKAINKALKGVKK